MAHRHLTWCSLACLMSCADWPRYENLPQEDTDALPSSVDPRSLFAVTWSELDEREPNDATTEAQSISLTAYNVGVALTATAEGIGWADGLDTVEVSDTGCGSTGELTAGVEDGSWLGDVDTYQVTLTEPGLLCARARLDSADASYGWDLLLFEVDDCGVPQGALRRDGSVLGYGLSGRADGWGVELDAGTWVAAFAPFSPNDLDAALDYRLGFSLLQDFGNDEELCPLLPDEEVR